MLGEPWKIDIDLRQVCAYAEDGYAAEAPGSMISGYVSFSIFIWRSVNKTICIGKI